MAGNRMYTQEELERILQHDRQARQGNGNGNTRSTAPEKPTNRPPRDWQAKLYQDTHQFKNKKGKTIQSWIQNTMAVTPESTPESGIVYGRDARDEGRMRQAQYAWSTFRGQYYTKSQIGGVDEVLVRELARNHAMLTGQVAGQVAQQTNRPAAGTTTRRQRRNRTQEPQEAQEAPQEPTQVPEASEEFEEPQEASGNADEFTVEEIDEAIARVRRKRSVESLQHVVEGFGLEVDSRLTLATARSNAEEALMALRREIS